jgi:hypothetical protein
MSHNDFDHRHYVILATSDISKLVFSEVLETSVQTLRTSTDGTQTFIKYDEEQPACLDECSSKSEPYSHDEFLTIVSTAAWSEVLHDVDSL